MKVVHHEKIHHKHSGESSQSSEHTREQKFYYWIWFSKDSEHKGLWGAYSSYEEAERKAISKLNVPYEIVKLTTRDETEASRRLRSNMLNETADVKKTFNRMSHKET